MYPKDVTDSIIVDVLRPDDTGNYRSIGTEKEIEEDDISTYSIAGSSLTFTLKS